MSHSHAIFVALPLDYNPEEHSGEIQKCIDDWGYETTKEKVVKAFKQLMNPHEDNDMDNNNGCYLMKCAEGSVIHDMCVENKYVLNFSPYVSSDSGFILNVLNIVWLKKIKNMIINNHNELDE